MAHVPISISSAPLPIKCSDKYARNIRMQNVALKAGLDVCAFTVGILRCSDIHLTARQTRIAFLDSPTKKTVSISKNKQQ